MNDSQFFCNKNDNQKDSIHFYAQAVKSALQKHGAESPLHSIKTCRSTKEQLEAVSHHVFGILESLGLDLDHPDLKSTPDRVAKMYVNEIFSGLDYSQFPVPSFSQLSTIKSQYSSVVRVDCIEMSSYCMHHLASMQGKATVEYMPRNLLLGLSKIHRTVKFFASRPQLQELLTLQCLIAFQTLLETPDVQVTIEATHGCVRSRGIRDSESITRTIQCGGAFKANRVKNLEAL